MTKQPCSSVSCDKCGQPMHDSFEEALIAQCRLAFLDIDDPRDVADVLCSNGVISNQIHEDIQENVEAGKKKEARQSLFRTVTRRPNWLQALTSALENTHVDCSHVAQRLREIKENLEKTHKRTSICLSEDDVFLPGESPRSGESQSLDQPDCGGDSSDPYQDCMSQIPSDREENPYCNVSLATGEEHVYDHLQPWNTSTDKERRGQDPSGQCERSVPPVMRRESASLKRKDVHSDSFAQAAQGHRRVVSEGTPAPRRYSQEGPKTCPVYVPSARLRDDTEFFSSDSSFNDVRNIKGWAPAENVEEAKRWLNKNPRGSYFMCAEEGQLVLAIKFESAVERIYVEKTKSCGLEKYKLQGYTTLRDTRRELLESLVRDGLRSSKTGIFEKLRNPWSAKS